MTTDGMLALHTVRRGRPGALPLVLLHGFPLDHRMWSDTTDLMAGDPTVLAPDLPGFGRSPVGEDVAEALGEQGPSIEVMADAVAATLHAAGVQRAVIAGLSMGGYVAMAVVERHPALVAGLGLLDTKSTADPDAARENRLRVADAVLADDSVDAVLGMRTTLLGATSRVTRPDLVEHLEAWITDQGPRGVAWAQRAMAVRADRTAVLGRVHRPALVVVGAEDELTPPDAARAMAEVLPDADLVVVPAAGHMTPIENPEPVAVALGTLLRRSGG
ncbi:alpha/beta fold hydrolase [Isoptericola sp. b441]|uniref:Alpha/beta fold hydrolase n=1 Tax=Actinotalea lenta TaxID=3064654 RepID=A0ABT9DBJ9_9CELL|nr:alpha/beta fold hydrolase [Isoptericola sp. b441]MDO8108260.1 alpha/beta fold hydrolase [Isoptericola sp. b441]